MIREINTPIIYTDGRAGETTMHWYVAAADLSNAYDITHPQAVASPMIIDRDAMRVI